VLDQLNAHNAIATFFCIGDNVTKYPAIFNKVVAASHGIGNHTFSHYNGWKTSVKNYTKDIEKCAAVLQGHLSCFSPLFRPPYGRITPKQAKVLKARGYSIVMWSVLSKDYDPDISKQQCLKNVLTHIKPGSIVVFHDSLKAFKNLQYVLPKVLEHSTEMGWQCKALPVSK
jgi:peptidoglycan/xylan/chitin deacetylase (PgdA/CDA1 family)